MKTWYEGHDKAYTKRKEMGWIGWSEKKEEIDEKISILEKVISADYVPQNGSFLEMGCGPGNVTLWAANKGYNAYGVDISPTAINWAKEKASENNIHVDFEVGNVLNLNRFEDNFFDFILDGHCLHCIIGDDRKQFLSSAYRVLKKGGFFHIGTMCNEPAVKDGSFDEVSRCTIYGDIASRYIGMAKDILEEIEKSGFTIIESKIVRSKSDDMEQDELLVECIK